jgi:hypothetical protein
LEIPDEFLRNDNKIISEEKVRQMFTPSIRIQIIVISELNFDSTFSAESFFY